MVGRLAYLSHPRSDLVYSTTIINQVMHDPHTSYLDVVYHILRYLKFALGKGLFSNNDRLKVEAHKACLTLRFKNAFEKI